MTTQIAGVQLGLPLIIAAAAAAQFILLALIAIVAPVRMKKPLAVSIALLIVGWGFAFDAKSMMKSKDKVAQASTMGESRSQGSCASIRKDMSGNEVRKKLGVPDEVRRDDKVRGPGSTVLIYKDLRCAVHLFDERVELVD